MDRAQKEKVVEELGQIFESSGVVVVAHYAGLTVAEMQDLRSRMREAEGSVRVAKNRLAKIALQGKPNESLSALLSGMTVFAYSEDPTAAARVMDKYAKDNEKLKSLAVPWVKRRLMLPVSKRLPICRRVRSLSLRSWAASVHLLRASRARLAHLLRTWQASFRQSRSARKRRETCVGVKGRNVGTHMETGTVQWLI